MERELVAAPYHPWVALLPNVLESSAQESFTFDARTVATRVRTLFLYIYIIYEYMVDGPCLIVGCEPLLPGV